MTFALFSAGSCREAMRFVLAVCGAYNPPDVSTAVGTRRYTNATVRGANANRLAQDAYQARLFRTA